MSFENCLLVILRLKLVSAVEAFVCYHRVNLKAVYPFLTQFPHQNHLEDGEFPEENDSHSPNFSAAADFTYNDGSLQIDESYESFNNASSFDASSEFHNYNTSSFNNGSGKIKVRNSAF